jgi:hypothetical protein
LNNKRIDPVLIELSGGILFNATEKKETDDESKMAKKMKTMLDNYKTVLKMDYPFLNIMFGVLVSSSLSA